MRVTNDRGRAGQALALQLDRVLPLGRAGRRHELPAQLLDRRGRDRGGRHLPQVRVPRAARSLRLLRLLGAAGRLRHAARRVPRALPRLGPADRRRARAGRPTRSRTAGSRLALTTSGSSSPQARRARSSSCSATARTRGTRKFDPPGSQTIDKRRVRPIIERYLEPAAVDGGLRGPARLLDGSAGHVPGRDRQRARRSHGQHLERLPVHGDVQPVALGLPASSRASAVAWASATPTRTCSASSTWSRRGPASGSSTSLRRSCRPAAPTTSTSR